MRTISNTDAKAKLDALLAEWRDRRIGHLSGKTTIPIDIADAVMVGNLRREHRDSFGRTLVVAKPRD
ncbi:hypothetical protein [Rhodococcus sp. NPDC058521]|uniref:hypothetical protein n=1 Tax=Rhodococcus sp. NPDC058521 TaxID=3346536 RepID=UPI00364D01C3